MTGALFRQDGLMFKSFALEVLRGWRAGAPDRFWRDAVTTITETARAIAENPFVDDRWVLEDPLPHREPGEDDDDDATYITVGDFLDGLALGFFMDERDPRPPRFHDNEVLWQRDIAAQREDRTRHNHEWVLMAGQVVRAALDAEKQAVADMGPLAGDDDIERVSVLEEATQLLRRCFVSSQTANRIMRVDRERIEQEMAQHAEGIGR